MIKKWLPQSDILAHPNGGLFGTFESVDRGIPLLIIPFFGDQSRNGHQVENVGYGRMLPHAVNMSWFLYLLIDVFIATIQCISFIIFMFYSVIKICCICIKKPDIPNVMNKSKGLHNLCRKTSE